MLYFNIKRNRHVVQGWINTELVAVGASIHTLNGFAFDFKS